MFGPPRGASAGRRKVAAAVGSRSQGSRFVPTDAIAVFDDTYARHRPAPEAPLRAPTPAVRSVAVAASPSQCSIAVAARPRVAVGGRAGSEQAAVRASQRVSEWM